MSNLSPVTIPCTNPATGAPLRYRRTLPDDALQAVLTDGLEAQRAWALRPPEERVEPLLRVAEGLRAGAEASARLMAEEMGKPLAQGRAEVEKCALACEHYAEHGPTLLRPEPLSTDGGHSALHWRPLGLVLAVMPWNFPFWQVVRFAAPTLLAGNGVLVKHAPGVPGCAETLAEVFEGAGLPAGLYADLVLEEPRVADLIARPEVAAVTLTGSTRAGRAVAAAAGAALKKTVLELGGSDAYVVLADADVDAAAAACVEARLVNSGQSCIAAKRFVVVDAVREAFTARVVERMAARRWGDPLADEAVDLGPLARVDLRDALHEQVTASVAAGARLLLGGEVPDGPGAFYPPTVLADVRPGMPAFDEETFGPVAAVVPARDEDEAFELANRTVYGLGGAVFTADPARGERLAVERLEAGSCSVNAMVFSDPRAPFGGIKASGHGRELGALGMREFCQAKVVRVAGGV